MKLVVIHVDGLLVSMLDELKKGYLGALIILFKKMDSDHRRYNIYIMTMAGERITFGVERKANSHS